jgi:hypothetical protein
MRDDPITRAERPGANDSLETPLRCLVALMAPLAEPVNQDAVRFARQDALNERLTLAIERIETLLARLIRPQANGRDA